MVHPSPDHRAQPLKPVYCWAWINEMLPLWQFFCMVNEASKQNFPVLTWCSILLVWLNLQSKTDTLRTPPNNKTLCNCSSRSQPRLTQPSSFSSFCTTVYNFNSYLHLLPTGDKFKTLNNAAVFQSLCTKSKLSIIFGLNKQHVFVTKALHSRLAVRTFIRLWSTFGSTVAQRLALLPLSKLHSLNIVYTAYFINMWVLSRHTYCLVLFLLQL